MVHTKFVSIPFKRDSPLQVKSESERLGQHLVSIPFKRDSPLQVVYFIHSRIAHKFQFPSNGIALCKQRKKLKE